MVIEKLMNSIHKGGDEALEAALALGTLLESYKVYRPVQGDEEKVRGQIKAEYRDIKFTETEFNAAVDQLIDYVKNTPDPLPAGVWALTKSYETRALPILTTLFEKVMQDPAKEQIAIQILNSLPSYNNEAVTVEIFRKAAGIGSREIQEKAKHYMEIHPDLFKDF